MTTQTISPFELLDTESLAAVEGGKTIYYGNGHYCNRSRCWTDWSQAWGTIINNSVMNGLTGCKAGWHSGGIA